MSVTLPGPVLTVLRDVQLMKYSNFFTVTMLVYDYMLTFGDEVRLIWPWEWRVGKILYIATKYSPFVDVPVFLAFWFNGSFSAAECQTLFNIGVWFVSAGAIISEWILCMRTYAIWEKSNIVFYPLLTFVLGAQIVGLWATKTLVSSLQFSLSPFPTLSRCYINETKTNVFFVVYILIMLVELTILTLTIWKGVSQWRSSRSALVKVLYRDGVFYFTVMFVISLTNFAMSTAAPKMHQDILTFFLPEVQRVLHSICTSHIILNLREASAGDAGLGIDGGAEAAKMYLSTLRFGIGRAFNRGRETKSKVQTGVEEELDYGGNTTFKTDNWASETFAETDTTAVTETMEMR